MKLFRTHLVPVLTIMAGGAIGASLSFSFLGSNSDAVPPVVVDLQPVVIDVPAIQKPVLRIEVDGYPVVTAERIEVRGLVVTPSATRESAIQTEGPDGSIVTSARIMFGGMVISPVVESSATTEVLRSEATERVRRLLAADIRQFRSEARQRVQEALELQRLVENVDLNRR